MFIRWQTRFIEDFSVTLLLPSCRLGLPPVACAQNPFCLSGLFFELDYLPSPPSGCRPFSCVNLRHLLLSLPKLSIRYACSLCPRSSLRLWKASMVCLFSYLFSFLLLVFSFHLLSGQEQPEMPPVLVSRFSPALPLVGPFLDGLSFLPLLV